MHKEAIGCDLTSERKIEESVKKMNTNQFQTLKVLHFLIQHNLPHTTLSKPLVELCTELGATHLPYLHKGKNANYTSHRIVSEFLECQAEVVEKDIVTKLKNDGTYGLMVDEYTDVCARKHLALVAKFLDAGQPRLAFLKDIQLPNGSADIIYTAMKNHLHNSDIPLDQLVSFVSDGPSVMVGKKNGVVAKLRKDNEHIIPLHCMNHRLQLAVSKAFHEVQQIEAVDELLSALFKYYHYSTVKSGSLQAVQNIFRDTGELDLGNNLSMKKAVHTRWLSHENSVQTVRKLYVPICVDLGNAVTEGRDRKLGDRTGVPAGSLLKMMETYEKVFFIHLLCDVCSLVSSLTRLFERDTVDLSVVQPMLQVTLLNIQKLKLKDGPYTSKASSVCEELSIPVNHKLVVTSRDRFLDSLTGYIEVRLENSDLINNLSCLNLSQVPQEQISFYGDQEISSLAEHLGLDVDQTLFEWNSLKEMFMEDIEKCTASYVLQILTKKAESLGKLYLNVQKLLAFHETLILSTAPIERCFSKVKLTVTDHRNRLAVESTNKLLMVALNTRTVADIDLDEVVKTFLDKKNRRIL